MDPKKLFADQRFTGLCVYCGGIPSTSDHVPSKVLLDEPFPPNLPVVPACEECNNRISIDEQYLACIVECVLAGSTDPMLVGRKKVKRILTERPALTSLIAASRLTDESGNVLWKPDAARIQNVILKLARGHYAYECSESRIEKPLNLSFTPLCVMSSEQQQRFETPPVESIYPEIGSRAFLRVPVLNSDVKCNGDWNIIQPGQYRYFVSYSGPTVVRLVIGEYLAAEVVW